MLRSVVLEPISFYSKLISGLIQAKMLLLNKMLGHAVFLAIVALCFACSPADPTTGLYVDDTSTAATESGSSCEPYKSLTAALAALEAGTGGKIIIATTASSPVFADVTLTQAVEIEGAGMTVSANGKITATGALNVSNLKFTQGTLATDYFLLVRASVSLTSSTVTGFNVGCIKVESGTLSITDSTFSSITGTTISVTEFGASLTDLRSTYSSNTKAVEFKPSSSSNTQSVISISSSKFTASPISIDVSTAYSTTAQHKLIMTSVVMSGTTGTLLIISAQATLINLTSCTFSGASVGISLVVSGVSGSINNCTFTNLKSNGLLVTSLKVNFTVSGCNFISNNYGATFSSIDTGISATITGCTFQNNKNASTIGAGLFTNGGDVYVKSSKFIGNTGTMGGALYITLGNLFRVSDTEITDTSSNDYPAIYCFRMKLAEHINVTVKNVVSKGNLLTYSINENLTYKQLQIENSSAITSAIFIDGTAMAMFYFNTFTNVVAKFSFLSVSGRAGMELQDTKFIGVSSPYIFYKILLFSNCIRCTFQFTAPQPEAIIIEHTGSQGKLDGCEFSGNFKAVTYGESQSSGCLVQNSYFHDGTVESLFGLNYYPLELYNITARNLIVTKPLDYPLNQGTVTARDIRVYNSTGGFFFLQNSPMQLTNLEIYDFSVIDSSKFMKGAGSKINFKNVVVSNFKGIREGSLFSLTDQS